MERVSRDRVGVLTGALTAVSLALVFAAAGGAIPPSAVPTAPTAVLDAIPTVNVVLSVVAIATIGYGWRSIRRGKVSRHRLAMLASVALFATFLVLYLYRLVAIGGAESFTGPEAVYRFVYLPILTIHMGLAMLCIPLLYYVLLLAVSRPTAELYATRHATVGRVAASLWIVSFALGVVVYALLHVAY